MRMGRSLETTVTREPRAARAAATDRTRVSLSPSRTPSGSSVASVWPSSTRRVPPWSLTGMGLSRRP